MPTVYPCIGWVFIAGDYGTMPDELPMLDEGDLVCDACIETAYPHTKGWGGYEEREPVNAQGKRGFGSKYMFGGWQFRLLPGDGSVWLLDNGDSDHPTAERCACCDRIVAEADHLSDPERHGLEACECPKCQPERYPAEW